jgi:hypothetical protein
MQQITKETVYILNGLARTHGSHMLYVNGLFGNSALKNSQENCIINVINIILYT